MTTALARIRDDLVVAIAVDRRRSLRRRRAGTVALATAAAFAAVGTSIAATHGLFTPAPDKVKETFSELDGAPGVDGSKAIKIGVIDEHAVYAAPAKDGAFCLHFAENPRSGPSGTACVPGRALPGEIALNVSLGTDGGFAFGRVGAESSATVEVVVPNGGGTLTTAVGEEGFFLAELPDRALRALTVVHRPGPKDPATKDGGPIHSLDQRRIDAIAATARDAQGTVVARGRNASLPDPGTPTTTTSSGGRR
jgi:hypothetical protein